MDAGGFRQRHHDASTQTAGVTVYASGGNDTLTGSAFNDFLWAGVGDDAVNGGGGNDVIVGDLGADSLSGGDGDDQIYTDGVDSFLDGGGGNDALYIVAGAGVAINLATTHFEWVGDYAGGNDAILASGSAADTVVYAGAGNDLINGGAGNDFLWGEAGNDTITGDTGNDTLVGVTGGDNLTGGAGVDTIFANSGGGDGAADTIFFANNWGVDFVFDFEHGIDKLDMTGVPGVHNFSDLAITSSGGNAVIGFGGNTISVAGNAGQLTADDFVFNSSLGIVITEIMANPTGAIDPTGEWFEVQNAGSSPIDLEGWTIKIGNKAIVVNHGGPLVVAADGLFVFAASSDPLLNGGLPVVGYETGLLGMKNMSDSVSLFDASDNLIDEVDYNSSFPLMSGFAMSLLPSELDNNNVASSWIFSSHIYGDGDYGTPGYYNDFF